jgi:hypothetical protein
MTYLRRRRQPHFCLERLEPRLLLSSAIAWSTSSAPTGGDWDVGSNWVGGKVPGPNDTAVISGLRAPGTVSLNSQGSVSVSGLSTDSTTTLKVTTGSLDLGAGSSSTLGGPTNIMQGASLNVGVGATLQIATGQALIDDGTLSFSRGDSLRLEGLSPGGNILSQITVNGVMNAMNTNFQGDSPSGISAIQVNSGGRLVASNCAYTVLNLTLSSGSNDTLNGLVFSGQLAINSGAIIAISGNDFSNVGQEGIVASGDARATINLERNYWGTSSFPEIQSKILDHTIDSSRPTVDFQNFVTLGPATKLVIQTQPSATATAGKAIATQPVVYVEDDSGNLETNDNSTVVSVAVANGSGPLHGTLTATVSGGVARFTGVSDNRAGLLMLAFASPSLTGATSTQIVVSAAPASKLIVTGQPPTTVGVGAGFALRVSAEDQFDNIDPAFHGAVTLALGANPGLALLGGPLKVTAVGGIAEFSGVTVSKAGKGYTLQATTGNLASATTDSFDVPTTTTTTQPTVVDERVVLFYPKSNKKGKPIGNPAVAFILQYSAAMSTKTVNSVSNYQVDWTAIKKVKKKLVTVFHPDTFTATYNAATQTVTLKTSSPAAKFAKGGEVFINGSGSTGVSSQLGALLNANYTKFKILPRAGGITLD